MGGRIRTGVRGVLAALPILSLAACQVVIHGSADGCDGEPAAAAIVPHEPRLGKNPSMHALAGDLDHLEKHIDWHGSVVAKTPDVWGQARLTQYREDFEREMRKDLDQFDLRLNGAVSRADASLFTYSQAISVAAAGKPAVPGTPAIPRPNLLRSLVVQPPADGLNVAINNAGDRIDLIGGDGLSIIRSTPQAPIPGRPATPAVPPNPTIPDSAATLPGSPAGAVLQAVAPTAALKTAGISLEPTIELAQKKRYLDFLNQLRRENEGGDTADAPGYQLNLLRIPVSVLPGKHTDRGHGAEVTFTIDSVLGDDLLPTTFRRMAVNDLALQFGFPLTDLLYDKDTLDQLNPKTQKVVRLVTRLNDLLTSDPPLVAEAMALAGSLCPEDVEEVDAIATVAIRRALRELRKDDVPAHLEENCPLPKAFADGGGSGDEKKGGGRSPPATGGSNQPPPYQGLKQARPLSQTKLFAGGSGGASARSGPTRRAGTPGATAGLSVAFSGLSVPFATGLDNKLPFPTSQLIDVYGEAYVFEIAYAVKQALAGDVEYTKYPHMPDVQSLLKEETQAAYQFLAKNSHLIGNHCTPDLVRAVRSRNVEVIARMRAAYRSQVADVTGSQPKDPRDPTSYRGLDLRQFSLTAALGWCLIVDSALLTDRLLTDMRESATAKGVASPCPADVWPQFFLPDPPAEERCRFNEYVKMRWPIHVFALDPMTQEQNLLDSLQTQREMQLALSVAFTSGRIGSRLFTQYARKLQAQYDTIALNRTQVGFAHGENTFGWRFYPRFQTPPTQSNLTTLVRDQLIGGPSPNALLRQRRLEPGPRECVALVIMPSFVPYVTVDSVSNWFGLANPKHKVLDHTQALHLSKTVRALETGGCAIPDADRYRDGELRRLQARVKQLGDRLPAQTLTVPVPIVNTVGGFEMFSNGTTDLAPQLYGFYGAPGVAADKETTLFLVGDHFSPLQTRVIVGNMSIDKDGTPPKQRMLSRQVMQVTVPAGVLSLPDEDGQRWVHAHVATPYGVSREVYIPLVTTTPVAAAAKPGYTIPDNTTLTVRYGMDGRTTPVGHFLPVFQGVKQREIRFHWQEPLGLATEKVELTFVFPFRGAKLTVPCVCKPLRVPTTAGTEVVLDAATLKAIGCKLLRQIRHQGALPTADNSLTADLVAEKVYVTPVAPAGHTAAAVEAGGKFTVKFEGQGLCPPDWKDECECPPAAVTTPTKVPPFPKGPSPNVPNTPVPATTTDKPVAGVPPAGPGATADPLAVMPAPLPAAPLPTLPPLPGGK